MRPLLYNPDKSVALSIRPQVFISFNGMYPYVTGSVGVTWDVKRNKY